RKAASPRVGRFFCHWFLPRNRFITCQCKLSFPSGVSIVEINLEHYIMSNLKLKGNWNELKGKVKQQYADLTDDDLLYEEGKEDELIGRLQKKTGKARDEVVNWLNQL